MPVFLLAAVLIAATPVGAASQQSPVTLLGVGVRAARAGEHAKAAAALKRALAGRLRNRDYGKTQIATLVERQSRFAMLVKLDGRDAQTVNEALKKQIRRLPAQLRRSLDPQRCVDPLTPPLLSDTDSGDPRYRELQCPALMLPMLRLVFRQTPVPSVPSAVWVASFPIFASDKSLVPAQ